MKKTSMAVAVALSLAACTKTVQQPGTGHSEKIFSITAEAGTTSTIEAVTVDGTSAVYGGGNHLPLTATDQNQTEVFFTDIVNAKAAVRLYLSNVTKGEMIEFDGHSYPVADEVDLTLSIGIDRNHQPAIRLRK